jgi:hypothetical protein
MNIEDIAVGSALGTAQATLLRGLDKTLRNGPGRL